jgi:hypothetical protein
MRRRRQTRKYRGRHRGGALGRIPPTAIVSMQQDPYSARMLVDAETAEAIFDTRDSYLL